MRRSKIREVKINIVNLIVNSSVSVVVIAYFIFRDYKFNNKLVEYLAKIEQILDTIIETKGSGKK